MYMCRGQRFSLVYYKKEFVSGNFWYSFSVEHMKTKYKIIIDRYKNSLCSFLGATFVNNIQVHEHNPRSKDSTVFSRCKKAFLDE